MKTIVNYLTGSFVNYAGQSQQIIICAITSEPCCPVRYVVDEEDDEGMLFTPTKRQLHLGISIQNPNDLVNEELGKKIAFGKAVNSTPVMVSTIPGIITKEVVDAVMQKTLKYVQNSPENYIATYAKNKAKFNANKQLLDKYNNLSDEDKKLVDLLKTKNIDELKELSTRLR